MAELTHLLPSDRPFSKPFFNIPFQMSLSFFQIFCQCHASMFHDAGHLFRYVTNQPPKANSAFHPYGVGKWAPASVGKAKAGMVHSVSGRTRGVQVKLWDPFRTRAIPERLRSAITRRYTHPGLPLPLPFTCIQHAARLICSSSTLIVWSVGWLVLPSITFQVPLNSLVLETSFLQSNS